MLYKENGYFILASDIDPRTKLQTTYNDWHEIIPVPGMESIIREFLHSDITCLKGMLYR
jgi:hypothetical protein